MYVPADLEPRPIALEGGDGDVVAVEEAAPADLEGKLVARGRGFGWRGCGCRRHERVRHLGIRAR
jgi:hypothetical protein